MKSQVKTIMTIDNLIELGILRRRNKCALCNKDMDIKNYNIQLCKDCRLRELSIILDKGFYSKNKNKEFDIVKEIFHDDTKQ